MTSVVTYSAINNAFALNGSINNQTHNTSKMALQKICKRYANAKNIIFIYAKDMQKICKRCAFGLHIICISFITFISSKYAKDMQILSFCYAI
jgi:hypothetical protein